LFRGLDRADSCSVDAHKWLGVPKSCSAVLMRERGSLEAAFGHQERYMLREGDISIPVDRTLEYSRPLRSLRLWMCLRVHGAAQYRRWIESGLANARALAELVRASDGFELLNEPMLSTVCFRHVPAGVEDLDEHNVRLAWAIAAEGRVYLAPAVVDGSTCLRVCFVNFRTTQDAIPLVLDVARTLGDRLAAGGGDG
jgi:aromatic-L-amino-acid decarboxylase